MFNISKEDLESGNFPFISTLILTDFDFEKIKGHSARAIETTATNAEELNKQILDFYLNEAPGIMAIEGRDGKLKIPLYNILEYATLYIQRHRLYADTIVVNNLSNIDLYKSFNLDIIVYNDLPDNVMFILLSEHTGYISLTMDKFYIDYSLPVDRDEKSVPKGVCVCFN